MTESCHATISSERQPARKFRVRQIYEDMWKHYITVRNFADERGTSTNLQYVVSS